jgi:hypothetical protein
MMEICRIVIVLERSASREYRRAPVLGRSDIRLRQRVEMFFGRLRFVACCARGRALSAQAAQKALSRYPLTLSASAGDQRMKKQAV